MQIKNTQIDSLRQTICFKKKYVLALKKRLFLVKNNLAKKDEYERNEVDITIFQTYSMISNAQSFIDKKEDELRRNMNTFYMDIEELDKCWDKVVDTSRELAKGVSFMSSVLRRVLSEINWKKIDSDVEMKLSIYKNLIHIANEIQLGR